MNPSRPPVFHVPHRSPSRVERGIDAAWSRRRAEQRELALGALTPAQQAIIAEGQRRRRLAAATRGPGRP